MQMFLSVSHTCNPWSQPFKMLFVSSFICILNAVILWNMMPRGRFSPLGSSGPELLNYWWNTDVISASGHKCTLLKNIKIVSSIISFCFNLSHFHSCRCVCACFFLIWAWRHTSTETAHVQTDPSIHALGLKLFLIVFCWARLSMCWWKHVGSTFTSTFSAYGVSNAFLYRLVNSG